MSLTTDRKQDVIKEYATKSGDTGSPEVQIALLTERINGLTDHFKEHKKDKVLPTTKGLAGTGKNAAALFSEPLPAEAVPLLLA